MRTRVEKHRQERPPGWQTLEVPCHVGEAIDALPATVAVVLVDCLTLLVSNILLGLAVPPEPAAAEAAITNEVNSILAAHREAGTVLIVVSNEVGLGLVPDNPLARLYRDLLGRANQLLARHADNVYFLVAGLAVDVRAVSGGFLDDVHSTSA